MKIGELSQRTGIAASAIRYYEEQGLLEAPTRDANGYRHYSDAAVGRLELVRNAQRLGFALETIKGLFLNDGSCSKAQTVEQIDIRLEEVRQIEAGLAVQRAELLALRSKLEDSLRSGGDVVCPKARREALFRPDRVVTSRRERVAIAE
jgi:DNA-binding transcriptional MerR regulator